MAVLSGLQRMTRAVNQDYLATSAEIWKTAETNARALLPAYNFHSPTFQNSHNLAIILTLSGSSNFSTLSAPFFTVRLYVCLTYYTRLKYSYKCNLRKKRHSLKVSLKDGPFYFFPDEKNILHRLNKSENKSSIIG